MKLYLKEIHKSYKNTEPLSLYHPKNVFGDTHTQILLTSFTIALISPSDAICPDILPFICNKTKLYALVCMTHF